MKFIISLALLAIGVTAQTTKAVSQGDSSCDADYIVTNCLELEQAKADACGPLDYDCQCAAYQAIATCYNNCPNDPRAATAKNQVIVYCQNASLYGSQAKAKATQTGSAVEVKTTAASAAASTTAAAASHASASGTPSGSAAGAEKTNAAGEVMRNTGGAIMAMAGVMAAIL